jgi:uncharacterized repeat protein (TIGR01451 family)
MHPFRFPVLALCLIAFAGGGSLRVWAADPEQTPGIAEVIGSGPLETTIAVEKLEVQASAAGQEIRRWIPAERLNAGDEIHYTVRVRNGGKQPVDSIVVTKRLPFGVKYLRNSASGPAAEVQFSIDGGRTFATPEALSRAAGDGRKTPRKTLEDDYTHVRWVLSTPLRPASTALLRFRATFS